MMRWKPHGLVIHNTGGDDLPGFDGDTVLDTLNERGLKGYHWLQESADRNYWTMMLSRPDEPGEHVKGHNSEYIGFAFVGDFNKQAPDMDELTFAATSVAALLHLYGLTPADIIAHRDVPDNSTDCPGLMFTPELFERFRTMVAEQYEAAA
jgi:hypothetical protein